MSPGKKVVLVADHNSPSLISLAEHLGDKLTDVDVEVITAGSVSGALELAKQYRPEVAILISSLVQTGGRQSLTDLIKQESPNTRIIIVQAARKQGAG